MKLALITYIAIAGILAYGNAIAQYMPDSGSVDNSWYQREQQIRESNREHQRELEAAQRRIEEANEDRRNDND